MNMLSKYQATIVTPFHNVDMGMFANCAKSVRSQTIGFENIEWIIVVHNSEPDYLVNLQEMFRQDPNVIVKELNNTAFTPSSPRNYGTKFATSKYIGYLDGDDSYTENCLEVAINEAEETQSDVIWFRREAEKEDPSMFMPLATSLWDQTQKRIIVDKGVWQDDKMFSGLFGFATSYLYRLDFLRENNLIFSETMHFGEDFLFVVEALAKSGRTCFLPQHIGYHYYVNGNSLVQNGKTSAERMITYSEGFRDLFKTMRNYGIDSQENAQIQCGVIIARFILSSPELTVEDRRKIKDILGPDVSAMHLLPPNKNFDSEMRSMMLRMSQDVILNPECPGETIMRIEQDDVNALFRILNKNSETDYGLRYSFKNITSLEAYQYRLPVMENESLNPIIKLQTNVGERNIITSEKTNHYFLTQCGNLLPCTETHLKGYTDAFSNMLEGQINMLIARSYPIIRETNDGADIDTLKSLLVKEYFSKCYLKGGIRHAVFTSPMEKYFKGEREDDFYDLIVDALANDSLNHIMAFDNEDLVVAFHSLENNWEDMVEKINDDKRRNKVKNILKDGFKQPIVSRLWPNVKRITSYGSGEMMHLKKELEKYTGDIPHNNGYFFTEETIFGKACGDDTDLYECIKGLNFYELMPIENNGAERPLRWSEVEAEKPYLLIITNHAGLYRYSSDHIIVPREVTPSLIKFTIY